MGIEREAHHVAEPEIFGKDHQFLRLSVLKDLLVRLSAQTDVPNVFDFKAVRAKQRRERSRKVFVNENARALPHRPHLFVANGTRGVGERCKHILAEEVIFLHDLFDGHSARKLSDDEINRHTRAGDDRLSEPDLLINGYSRSDLGHVSRFFRPEILTPSRQSPDDLAFHQVGFTGYLVLW
jgi:hypothetical protein